MSEVGETLVCAPSGEQSAKGHSISVDSDMTLTQRERDGQPWAWALDGTPADCVKFAIMKLLDGRRPDLVVSGINRGRNTGVNILYSGTVAAAAEGVFFGVPSIAVSLSVSRNTPDIDFSVAGVYARRLAESVLREGLPEGVVLNMNVPYGPVDEIAGVIVSRMSRSMYTDRFDRQDAHGEIRVYRNVGDRLRADHDHEESDDRLLEEMKVSITPLHFDLTHHRFREELRRWTEELHSPDISYEIDEISHDLGAETVD